MTLEQNHHQPPLQYTPTFSLILLVTPPQHQPNYPQHICLLRPRYRGLIYLIRHTDYSNCRYNTLAIHKNITNLKRNISPDSQILRRPKTSRVRCPAPNCPSYPDSIHRTHSSVTVGKTPTSTKSPLDT